MKDPDGLPVCVATGDQLSPRAVPIGNGAVIVVWQDKRRGASLSDIYALSIDPNGSVTPGWPADGLALCASGTAGPPIPVPDGDGGAVVLWRDTRSESKIFAQRVSANGTIVGPTDGTQVTSAGHHVTLLDAIPDGAGGAFFVTRTAPHPIFQDPKTAHLAGIHANGASMGWSGSFGRGVLGDDVPYARLAADINGGVQVLFHDRYADWQKWKVLRFSPAGEPLGEITIPSHYHSPFLSGVQWASSLPDGAGGCFVSWFDDDGGTYMQHFLADGSPRWPEFWPAPTYNYMADDGEAGAYFVGSQNYPINNLEVNRFRDGASVPSRPDDWTAFGITLTPFLPSGSMGAVDLATVAGDLFLCWSDKRGASFDVRAVAIDPTGYVRDGWGSTGTLLSGATGDQKEPRAVSMSPEQILVCWQDQRAGAWDIRATRIGISIPPTGVEPAPSTGLALGAPWPNPAHDRLTAGLAFAGDRHARLEVFDVRGRMVSSLDRVETGTRAELDVRGLPAGVYWLRLTQGTRSASRRFAVMR